MQCENLHECLNTEIKMRGNATISVQNCANSIEEHIGWRRGAQLTWKGRGGVGWSAGRKGEKGQKGSGQKKSILKIIRIWGRLVVQAPYLSVFSSRYERRDCSLKGCRLVAEEDLAPLVQDYLGLGAPRSSLHRRMDKWSALGTYLRWVFF